MGRPLACNNDVLQHQPQVCCSIHFVQGLLIPIRWGFIEAVLPSSSRLRKSLTYTLWLYDAGASSATGVRMRARGNHQAVGCNAGCCWKPLQTAFTHDIRCLASLPKDHSNKTALAVNKEQAALARHRSPVVFLYVCVCF